MLMIDEQENMELLTEEAYSIREQRRKELENEYSRDDYRVIRKELFAHLRDPSITIRDGSITFNTACIKGLEGVIYIKLQISESLGKLTAERCDENDKNALRWCVAKDGKRKSRTMNCRPFTDLIYKTMGWDKSIRYKMLGYLMRFVFRVCGWKEKITYRVAGKLNPAKKRVEFDLSEALEIVEGRLKKPEDLLS